MFTLLDFGDVGKPDRKAEFQGLVFKYKNQKPEKAGEHS
jgi:hypothetical protein